MKPKKFNKLVTATLLLALTTCGITNAFAACDPNQNTCITIALYSGIELNAQIYDNNDMIRNGYLTKVFKFKAQTNNPTIKIQFGSKIKEKSCGKIVVKGPGEKTISLTFTPPKTITCS